MSRNYGIDQQKATKFALSINNQQNYGFNHIGNTNKTMGLRNGIPMDYLWIERTMGYLQETMGDYQGAGLGCDFDGRWKA